MRLTARPSSVIFYVDETESEQVQSVANISTQGGD